MRYETPLLAYKIKQNQQANYEVPNPVASIQNQTKQTSK